MTFVVTKINICNHFFLESHSDLTFVLSITIFLDLTDYQGMAQGCISGISSFANVVSPLVFSPLTGKLLKFALHCAMQ